MAREAMELRRYFSVALDSPVCPFEIATRMGLRVQFDNQLKSTEGLYVGSGGVILLTSLRPMSRQTYTCAHEIGHCRLKHSLDIIDLTGNRAHDLVGHFDSSRQEQEAEVFAQILLVTKKAFELALSARGIQTDSVTSVEAFRVACSFGVGLSTIGVVGRSYLKGRAAQWGNVTNGKNLPQIKETIVGRKFADNLVVVDKHWNPILPISAEVGDFIAVDSSLSKSPLDGCSLTKRTTSTEDWIVYLASAVGTQLVSLNDNLNVRVRVARKEYHGMWRFKYLPE